MLVQSAKARLLETLKANDHFSQQNYKQGRKSGGSAYEYKSYETFISQF